MKKLTEPYISEVAKMFNKLPKSYKPVLRQGTLL